MGDPHDIMENNGRVKYKKLKLYKEEISAFLDELGDLYSDIAVRGIMSLLTPNSDLRKRVRLIIKKCEEMGMYNTAALLAKFYGILNKEREDYTALVGIYNSLLTRYHLLRNKFNFITAETGEPSDIPKIVRPSDETERDITAPVTINVIPISLWTGKDNGYLLISYDYTNGSLVLVEGKIEKKKGNKSASDFKNTDELIEFYSGPIELKNVILKKLRDGDNGFPPIYGIRPHISTAFFPIKDVLPEVYDKLTECGVVEKFDPSIPVPEINGLKIGNSEITDEDAAVLWCLADYILKAYILNKPFFSVFRDRSKAKKFGEIVLPIFKHKYTEWVKHPVTLIIPNLGVFYYSGIDGGSSIPLGPTVDKAVDILGKFYRVGPPPLYSVIFSDPEEIGGQKYLTNLLNLWKQLLGREKPDWYIVYTLMDKFYKNGGESDRQLLDLTYKKIKDTLERFKSADKIDLSDIIEVCWAAAIIKNFTFLRFDEISEEDLNLILNRIGSHGPPAFSPFNNPTTLFEKFLKRDTSASIESDISSRILRIFEEDFVSRLHGIKSILKNDGSYITEALSEIYYILSPISLMWGAGGIHLIGKNLRKGNRVDHIIFNTLSYFMYFIFNLYCKCEKEDERFLYDKLTVLISDIIIKLRIMMEFPF